MANGGGPHGHGVEKPKAKPGTKTKGGEAAPKAAKAASPKPQKKS